MIIEVMYKAKSPHSFGDSRPRDVIASIRSLACYTESVKHGGRPRSRVYMETIDAYEYRSYGQRIVVAQLDVTGSLPEGGSKFVGSDQN